MAQMCFVIGAVLPLLACAGHLGATLVDLWRPTFFRPVDDAVRVSMTETSVVFGPMPLWRAWLGFNLSHSIGGIAVSGIMVGLALDDFGYLVDHRWLMGVGLAFALSQLVIAVRSWFWVPAVVAAASSVLLAVALFTA